MGIYFLYPMRIWITCDIPGLRNHINTLKPRQNCGHFTDDIFKCIFLNENVWILQNISLQFISKVRINNIPAMVQIMVWCQPGDKSLSETMMVSLLTHICVTQPQSVKNKILFNSSDARDGIFRLWRSIPCLLMHWLLKSPVHQQAWHWQYRIGST